MQTTLLALAAPFLLVSGVPADGEDLLVSGIPAYGDVIGRHEAVHHAYGDDIERQEATQIKLKFYNHGTKEAFDVHWLNGEDNSEHFVTRLEEGEDYTENTYFGHNFVLSANNFKVNVDVSENMNPDNQETFPYLIRLENMAEEHLEFEFHIKSEYDVDDDEDEDTEALMSGESLQITTGSEKWFTIFDVNDTLVATFEILEHSHDEL
jgi:hypothetical protein